MSSDEGPAHDKGELREPWADPFCTSTVFARRNRQNDVFLVPPIGICQDASVKSSRLLGFPFLLTPGVAHH